MTSVYDMDRQQFRQTLGRKVRPSTVYKYACDIYGLLTGVFSEDCCDSLLREWAFQWASEKLGIEYDEIYQRWLNG